MDNVAQPVRWGILGTGWIASTFTTDLVATGHVVAAVGSRRQESADEFAGRFGIPKAHGSYEALVADPGVDAIYISTPHTFHYDNAKLALVAGKHALVEKSFTVNAREAREIVELAKSRNLVILEAMWTRTVVADHTQLLPSDPSHRILDPALGGGALLDLGIYPVSFAWDIFGKPQSITALSTPVRSTGVDGQTSILLGYPGGQQAVLHNALDTAGPNRAVILGTLARIEIDPVWYSATSFTVFAPDNTVVERFDEKVASRGMQYEAEALERLVASGELAGLELPPDESVEIMETLDEVRRQIGLVYPGEH
jgi:predicted dehydrogenase